MECQIIKIQLSKLEGPIGSMKWFMHQEASRLAREIALQNEQQKRQGFQRQRGSKKKKGNS